MAPSRQRIEREVLELLIERGTSTACPSEVARRLSSNAWRPLMPRIREVVAGLAERGKVEVFQRGRPANALEARGPIRLRLRESAQVDYRKHPERYRVGRGEEGVLTVEPYKGELLPLWRFATPEQATRSARALWRKFRSYGREGDFVGMDMARKFLQMGWTRSRRYARHRGGRKYARGTREELPLEVDPIKARSAEIFREYLDRAREDSTYRHLRAQHVEER